MPGHAIPEPYAWDESFKVFYEQLDTEHQGLFQGVFACIGGNNQANLDSLVKKVKDHFAYEEGQMQAAKYSNFDSHKKLHDTFVAKIGGASAPLDAATVDFVKDWLVQHIKDIDFQYKEKL